MAITTRIKQRYGFDGQVYAADDGIIIRLPDGDGNLPIRELLLFDTEELQRIIETQVGESVLYAARFRECAARSLFLPRANPGRRVPLWQQRLRAAQLLNAARTRKNFPLLLETARECLQDVYDLPALKHVMSGLRSGVISLSETVTETPSPFAENMLFGYVGAVMYQYDVPQAERSTQLLSMDPEVLERLLAPRIWLRCWMPTSSRRLGRSLPDGRSGTIWTRPTLPAVWRDMPKRMAHSPRIR